MQPSSAKTYYVKTSDTLPELRSVLRDGAGMPVPLTVGNSVVFRFKRHNSADPVSERPATIVKEDAPEGDPDMGAVVYKLDDLDAAVIWPGFYDVEWTVTFNSGDQATFPNYGYDVLQVSPRLG
jgi:hypothetical protein